MVVVVPCILVFIIEASSSMSLLVRVEGFKCVRPPLRCGSSCRLPGPALQVARPVPWWLSARGRAAVGPAQVQQRVPSKSFCSFGLRGNLLGEGSLCGGPEANAACAPSGEPWPSAGAEGCAQLRARWCTRTSGVSLRRGRARRSCSLRSCPRCCRTRVAPTYRRSFGRGRSRRAQQAAQAARRQRMRRRRRWPLLQRTFLPLLSTRRAATSVVGHSGGGQ